MGTRAEIIRKFKVLNLYACLGGNRYKWTDCDVTAVELDPELARLYQERFPNDTARHETLRGDSIFGSLLRWQICS
jgi:hypothetical protein